MIEIIGETQVGSVIILCFSSRSIFALYGKKVGKGCEKKLYLIPVFEFLKTIPLKINLNINIFRLPVIKGYDEL